MPNFMKLLIAQETQLHNENAQIENLNWNLKNVPYVSMYVEL